VAKIDKQKRALKSYGMVNEESARVVPSADGLVLRIGFLFRLDFVV